jgi:Glyoxalase-like domain
MADISSAAERQMPMEGEIFLDHVAHYVTSAEDAARGLRSAGFQPTPASMQRNPDGTLTGTGNVTAMLARGYLEMLFKTAATPLSAQFDAARARYPGLHLIAFSVAEARGACQRLEREGFQVRDIAEMKRLVPTETGEAIAAFTVVRVAPGEMAEGRVQILTHHTQAAVWQKRWLAHPNGAHALICVVIAVPHVEDAAERYARFTGRGAVPTAMGRAIALDRGSVQLVDAEGFAELAGFAPRTLPFIGLAAIQVKSLRAAEQALSAGHIAYARQRGAIRAQFPDELGHGAWLFVEDVSALPWRRQS